MTSFNAFVGAWGLLSALVGIASAFVNALELPQLALDGLAVLFTLAGAIAYAVKLGVHSCTPDGSGSNKPNSPPVGVNYYTGSNSVINGGTFTVKGEVKIAEHLNYEGRCRMAQADDAFLFFALAAFIASLIVGLMGSRGSRRGGGRSVV